MYQQKKTLYLNFTLGLICGQHPSWREKSDNCSSTFRQTSPSPLCSPPHPTHDVWWHFLLDNPILSPLPCQLHHNQGEKVEDYSKNNLTKKSTF